jgi:hypothetical protein
MNVSTLLKKWKQARPDYLIFCYDGILDESKYKISSPKILFLLKETHYGFTNITGPQGPKGRSKTFWRKMKMWTYITTSFFNGKLPNFQESLRVKEFPNDSVAYVNLKKNVVQNERSKNTNSNGKDLQHYVDNDTEYLRSQIDLIDPDVIFCCSTFNYFQQLYPDNKFYNSRLYKVGDRIIIDYFHPSNRRSYSSEFEQLSSLCKPLLFQPSEE